jgi:hypothetical protein
MTSDLGAVAAAPPLSKVALGGSWFHAPPLPCGDGLASMGARRRSGIGAVGCTCSNMRELRRDLGLPLTTGSGPRLLIHGGNPGQRCGAEFDLPTITVEHGTSSRWGGSGSGHAT